MIIEFIIWHDDVDVHMWLAGGLHRLRPLQSAPAERNHDLFDINHFISTLLHIQPLISFQSRVTWNSMSCQRSHRERMTQTQTHHVMAIRSWLSPVRKTHNRLFLQCLILEWRTEFHTCAIRQMANRFSYLSDSPDDVQNFMFTRFARWCTESLNVHSFLQYFGIILIESNFESISTNIKTMLKHLSMFIHVCVYKVNAHWRSVRPERGRQLKRLTSFSNRCSEEFPRNPLACNRWRIQRRSRGIPSPYINPNVSSTTIFTHLTASKTLPIVHSFR